MVTDDPLGANGDAVMDEAGKALFRFGRIFARLPRRDLLEAPTGRDAELSAILLVQAVEAAEAGGLAATVGGLAEHLWIDPSTASRLVAQTVRAGYLHREASQGDGRAVVLGLTDAGRALGDGAARYQRAVFDAAMRGWSGEEREAFARHFVRFAAGVVAMLGETTGAEAGVGVAGGAAFPNRGQREPSVRSVRGHGAAGSKKEER